MTSTSEQRAVIEDEPERFGPIVMVAVRIIVKSSNHREHYHYAGSNIT